MVHDLASQEMQTFTFGQRPVRVLILKGESWFVLGDVCNVLSIANVGNAAARLDDDEKGVHIMDTLGGPQQVTFINESGLYSLVLSSRKPEAKRFKKWVTSEVLPAIRKTGSYSVTAAAVQSGASAQGLSAQALRIIADTLDTQNARLAVVEEAAWNHAELLDEQAESLKAMRTEFDNAPIDALQRGKIHTLGQRLGRKIGFGAAWARFNRRFGLASYTTLPRRQFEEGVAYLQQQIEAEGTKPKRRPLGDLFSND